MNRTGLAVSLLVFLGLTVNDAFSQRRRTPPPLKPPYSAYVPLNTDKLPPDKKLRVETFEKVWRTILNYYFDGKFNNIDWLALKLELEPKVRTARSDDELHAILDTMLGRLKVSHLGIIRPAVFEAIETAKTTAKLRAAERESEAAGIGSDGGKPEPDSQNFDDPLSLYGPGIELRVIDDRFVVFRVGPNSAAEFRGIKPGFVIETIDDVSLSFLLTRVKAFDQGDSRVLRYLPSEIVSEMLNGEKDSTVKIGYLDGNDAKGEVLVRRELLPAMSVVMGSGYPEQHLSFTSRSLDENTGYIHFDAFSVKAIEKFCSALSDFKTKRSLIIDLRGNTGGVIGVSIALAGMLSDKPIDLGTSVYRYGPESLIAASKAKHFKGRIAILTDSLSVSAAEMFAASLQAAGRAKLIGTRTAGESLPSVAVELPTGARLIYPIANYRTADGRYLEGNGVTPDKLIALDRPSLLRGVDPQLAAATELLRNPETATVAVKEFQGPINTGSASASPPPPQPAKAKPVPKTLATVTVKAPPPPPEVIEPRAVDLIKGFEKLSGGLAAYSAIKSYELTGSVDTVSMATRNTQEFRSYRDGDRIHLLQLNSPVTGETRTYRDGKSISMQSDLGINYERPLETSVDEADFLFSIKRSMKVENYKKLQYLGEFERGSRKVHLIDGKTTDGVTVAIYFDTETKLLAGFEGPTGGLSFADYRKVGDLMFPFNISSQDFLNIQLTEVKLNTKIDPAVFERKVNCFDKPL